MWNKEPELYRGKYYARIGTGAQTKRKSLRTERLDVALRRLEDLRRHDQQVPALISEIYAQYMAEKENKYKGREFTWRTLKSFWGHLRPDQVTREKCREYAEIRNVSAGTIIKDLGTLRAALRWFDPNTPAVFQFPKGPPAKDRFLTRKEAKALIDCASPHIKLFCIAAICTAGRKGAILELQWKNVDFERGQINLGSGEENKRRAIVPMNQSLERALEDAYKVRLTDNVIEFRGKPVKAIKNGFEKACIKAGLNDVTPHTLRHTAAVWMAEGRVPMSEISQYLGHTSTKVTESVYARYSPEYLKKPAEMLELGSIEPSATSLVKAK